MTLHIGPIVLNPATHYYCAKCGAEFKEDYEQVLGDGERCWHLNCVEIILATYREYFS